jgi:hypothetical protein
VLVAHCHLCKVLYLCIAGVSQRELALRALQEIIKIFSGTETTHIEITIYPFPFTPVGKTAIYVIYDNNSPGLPLLK